MLMLIPAPFSGWPPEFAPSSHRQPGIEQSPHLPSKHRKMLEQRHSVSPISGYSLTFSLSSFRSEPSAIWSAQHWRRKALRLSLMRQSWPFSTPRRRRSAVQSATDAAPLCDVPWGAERAEFSETKQVRKAMKVTCNWNGEHDQKRVLLTQYRSSPFCETSKLYHPWPTPVFCAFLTLQGCFVACSHCCRLHQQKPGCVLLLGSPP